MKNISRSLLLAVCSVSSTAMAGSSPWLPEPMTLNAVFSYVFQTADRFYMGNKNEKLPTDLSQNTFSTYLEYGVFDNLTVDARLGYSFTNFDAASPKTLDGLTDTNIGIRWRAIDETVGKPVTLTFRAAGIINGSYRTGSINAIGDGASGGEFSALLGRFFDNGISLSAESGYRVYSKPVPNQFFLNLTGRYSFTQAFSAGASYQVVESLGGLDIGGPGFTPSRFPALNEDSQIAGFDLSYQVAPRTFISVNYGKVVNGRNTGDQDIVGINIGQGFF